MILAVSGLKFSNSNKILEGEINMASGDSTVIIIESYPIEPHL